MVASDGMFCARTNHSLDGVRAHDQVKTRRLSPRATITSARCSATEQWRAGDTTPSASWGSKALPTWGHFRGRWGAIFRPRACLQVQSKQLRNPNAYYEMLPLVYPTHSRFFIQIEQFACGEGQRLDSHPPGSSQTGTKSYYWLRLICQDSSSPPSL